MKVHDHACCPAPGVRYDGTRNPCVGYCFGGEGVKSCHATGPNFPCCFACDGDRKEVCDCPCHAGEMRKGMTRL